MVSEADHGASAAALAPARPAGSAKALADGAGLSPASLTLRTDGAVRFDRAALSILDDLRAIADAQPAGRAGVRLHGVERLRPMLAADGVLGSIAATAIGVGCRPVRAILFDKTEAINWALGWHQDRTIVVRERIETPGFGPWTIKSGLTHVAPPPDLLASMVTMRVHLDDVPDSNAPLLIAPGSHRLGRIPEAQVITVVERCGVATSLAVAGDVWLYATPILHASAASALPARRRVLQMDFASAGLPGALQWLGI